MYIVLVVVLTILAPIGSAVTEVYGLHAPGSLIAYLGKWYVFWAGGVRLFLAGLRQVFQPAWTLKAIFEIESAEPKPIVQELGFANLSMGLLCMMSLIEPRLMVAGAIVSGIYYGLAGLRHATDETRNTNQNVALLTDVLVSAVLAYFVVATVRGGG